MQTEIAAEDAERICTSLGRRGFPTYIVGKALMLRGYRRFDQFIVPTDELGIELVEKALDQSQSAVEAFAKKYGRVAPREVEEVFGLSAEEALSMLDSLVASGVLVKQEAGMGSMYAVV